MVVVDTDLTILVHRGYMFDYTLNLNILFIVSVEIFAHLIQ